MQFSAGLRSRMGVVRVTQDANLKVLVPNLDHAGVRALFPNRHVRRHLCGINHDQRAIPVRHLGNLVDGIDNAVDIRHPGDGDVIDFICVLAQRLFEQAEIDAAK